MIKTPMWLKKIQTNVTRSTYREMETFERDMMQIWANARIYNVDGSDIFELANELERFFQSVYREKMAELDAKQEEGTAGSSGTLPVEGPKLKLKLGGENRTHTKSVRTTGRTGKARNDDEEDDEEEEDARMSDDTE
jgi:hypothetical protein